MDKIDLETKQGTNCVTRWGDKAVRDLSALNEGQESGVWGINQGEAGAKKNDDDFDKVDKKQLA
jgi:hypothetical protein